MPWYVQQSRINPACHLLKLRISALALALQEKPMVVVLAGGGRAAQIRGNPSDGTEPPRLLSPAPFVWRSAHVQVMPQRWTCLSVDLKGYPSGMRYAVVFLYGRNGCLQPGHLGPMFAAPELSWAPQGSSLPMRPSSQHPSSAGICIQQPPSWPPPARRAPDHDVEQGCVHEGAAAATTRLGNSGPFSRLLRSQWLRSPLTAFRKRLRGLS